MYLNKILAADLDSIHFCYIFRDIDKEFSLPANYPKGHGEQFLHWLKRNHPGALLVLVARNAGSRQALAVEGAVAVYWNCRQEFLCMFIIMIFFSHLEIMLPWVLHRILR
jgi:hypothetical protein